jgi:hypothetical protein
MDTEWFAQRMRHLGIVQEDAEQGGGVGYHRKKRARENARIESPPPARHRVIPKRHKNLPFRRRQPV